MPIVERRMAMGRRGGILRGEPVYLVDVRHFQSKGSGVALPSWSASSTSWYVYPRAKLFAIGGCLLCRSCLRESSIDSDSRNSLWESVDPPMVSVSSCTLDLGMMALT